MQQQQQLVSTRKLTREIILLLPIMHHSNPTHTNLFNHMEANKIANPKTSLTLKLGLEISLNFQPLFFYNQYHLSYSSIQLHSTYIQTPQ